MGEKPLALDNIVVECEAGKRYVYSNCMFSKVTPVNIGW
jgi:hypothetical protein